MLAVGWVQALSCAFKIFSLSLKDFDVLLRIRLFGRNRVRTLDLANRGISIVDKGYHVDYVCRGERIPAFGIRVVL
jgi:hypothetical protein